VSERKIIDGRHALDPERYRAAGWDYRALGRPTGDEIDLLGESTEELLQSA
jgi:UDPglucose 6-dehydrogenase